jgi:hypothetical protein
MHCAVHQQVTVLVHDLNLTNVVRIWQILWDNPDEPSALFTLGCHYLKDGQTTYALEHLRCRDHARLQSLAVRTACVPPPPTPPPPHPFHLAPTACMCVWQLVPRTHTAVVASPHADGTAPAHRVFLSRPMPPTPTPCTLPGKPETACLTARMSSSPLHAPT